MNQKLLINQKKNSKKLNKTKTNNSEQTDNDQFHKRSEKNSVSTKTKQPQNEMKKRNTANFLTTNSSSTPPVQSFVKTLDELRKEKESKANNVDVKENSGNQGSSCNTEKQQPKQKRQRKETTNQANQTNLKNNVPLSKKVATETKKDPPQFGVKTLQELQSEQEKARNPGQETSTPPTGKKRPLTEGALNTAKKFAISNTTNPPREIDKTTPVESASKTPSTPLKSSTPPSPSIPPTASAASTPSAPSISSVALTPSTSMTGKFVEIEDDLEQELKELGVDITGDSGIYDEDQLDSELGEIDIEAE